MYNNKDIYSELEPITTPSKIKLNNCLLSYKILSADEKKKVDIFFHSQIKPIKKKQIRIFARENKISYTKVINYFKRCSERKEKEFIIHETVIMNELKNIWIEIDFSWKRYLNISEDILKNFYKNNK
ncbi:hypothetical protein H312_00067 [Anncaliia algerae PRA339]|uniref:Uncharacterized protein n=1 Tax=Anncaliia algerae PRA339 TaxID=1288291 RepID=A0A059F5X4_9MICR|nr:hypothetical protein H312_00067 [Anncaliia algerae PRA339]